MPLSFDPKLDPAKNRRKASTAQQKTQAVSSSKAEKKSARSSSAKQIKGKRKSVSGGAKAKRSSSRLAKEEAVDTRSSRRADAKDARANRKAAKERQKAREKKRKDAQENASEEEIERRQGKRVGDIRARERAKRNKKRYRRYIMRIAIPIVVVILLVFGGIFVYRSDLLAVKHIEVVGAEHLSNAEITRVAAVPDDSTLLRLDSAGIVERLKTHAWVQDATVSRKFPDSIEITIKERTPAAAVRIDDNTIWVISKDGAWLSAATKKDWKAYHRIVGVSTSLAAPVAGSDCNDEGIKNAISIYGSVSTKLLKKIKRISAESAAKTTLILKNGVTVAFGDASDIKLKEAAIWKLLSKYKDTVSYINVRVPSRPAYRTLEADE